MKYEPNDQRRVFMGMARPDQLATLWDQDAYFRGELAIAYLMTGAFEDAFEQADLSLMRRGAYWFSHVVKINALLRKGDRALAKDAVVELKASIPKFGLHFIDWVPFMDTHWNRFLGEGVNLAMAEND